MSGCIDALKQMNLVDFLTAHYGLDFKRSGSEYVASSPFGADRRPSFFVRQLEGRWLFKDFSSGLGGSIIDLVGHLERLTGVGEIIGRIEELIGGKAQAPSFAMAAEQTGKGEAGGYDIEELYARFREQDPEVCRRYLLGRGIGEELVAEMITGGEVVHNRYRGKSYCCFAVRDAEGALRCLDNHEIDGGSKFVLGKKSVYSRDWAALPAAKEAFISEGIIDYLSVKTLNAELVGLALLGNQLIFDQALLAGTESIIAALDNDSGGGKALIDLSFLYPEKIIGPYPLDGHKDPNELLKAKKGISQRRRLSTEEKLKVYQAFQRSSNKSALSREWGIDRSYLYEVVDNCEKLLLEGLAARQAGRRPACQPGTVKQAWEEIKELRARLEEMSLERDKSICREEFLRLRLKWAEIEAAELRGEPVDEKTGPKRKAQIKKKKKRRR